MAWLEDSIEEFKKLKTPAKVAVLGGVVAAGLIGVSYVRSHHASGGGAAVVTNPLDAYGGAAGAFSNNATGASDATGLAAIMAQLQAIMANVTGARTDASAANNTLNNIWKRTYGNNGGADKHGPPTVLKIHPIEKMHH